MIHKILDILLICLLIIGCCLAVGLRVYGYINQLDTHDHSTDNMYLNKEHTGLACCPCGVCHITLPEKHTHEGEGEDNKHVLCHHKPRIFSLGLRFFSTIVTITLVLAALSI